MVISGVSQEEQYKILEKFLLAEDTGHWCEELPDSVHVYYIEDFGWQAIEVPGEGLSGIKFCPWCGKAL